MCESELVFAYGSNMDPGQMRERCPGSDLSWFVAEARGWRLWFPRQSKKRKGSVGSLAPDTERSVWGVVFSVSKRDFQRLDHFEGVPNRYQRELIEVVHQDQRDSLVSKVWTYFAVPQDNPPKGYLPSRDYLNLYIRGAEYFGLPPEYLEPLRNTKASEQEL